jgi:hypothetical protein
MYFRSILLVPGSKIFIGGSLAVEGAPIEETITISGH